MAVERSAQLQHDPHGTLSEAEGAPREREWVCDHCERTFRGDPAGSGLFVWTRGDEIRYESPPLCEECARAITGMALRQWAIEDEEEG